MISSKIGICSVVILSLGTPKMVEAGEFKQVAARTEFMKTSVWSVEKNLEVSKISKKQSKRIKRKLQKSKKIGSKPQTALSPKEKIGVGLAIFLSLFTLLCVGIGLVQSIWVWILLGAAGGLLLTIWWIFSIFKYSGKGSVWIVAILTAGYASLSLGLCVIGFFWAIVWALVAGFVLLLNLYILLQITQPNILEAPTSFLE